MSVEELIEVAVVAPVQYVCFIKRRAGHHFVPYTQPGKSDAVAVKTLRQFLDHEIDLWYSAGKDEKVESRPILAISLEDFVADVNMNGMNARLVSLLGWNYPRAARLVESEGMVFLLTIHPRFPSLPFSFRRVAEDDSYALHFVERILSLRGGEIAFEEYDPVKHVAGCQFGGVSAVSVPNGLSLD